MRPAIAAVGLIAALALLLSGCGRTSAPRRETLVAPHDDAAWVAPVASHASSGGAASPMSLCVSKDCGPDAAVLHWSIAPWAHPTTGYYIYVTNTALGKQVADVHSSPLGIPGGHCGTSVLLGVRAHDDATPTPDTSPLYSFRYTTPACGGGGARGDAPGTQPVGDPRGINWTLTFDDEFNGTSIDPSKWVVYNDPAKGCPGTAATCHPDHDNNAVASSMASCREGPFGPNGEGVLDLDTNGTEGCDVASLGSRIPPVLLKTGRTRGNWPWATMWRHGSGCLRARVAITDLTQWLTGRRGGRVERPGLRTASTTWSRGPPERRAAITLAMPSRVTITWLVRSVHQLRSAHGLVAGTYTACIVVRAVRCSTGTGLMSTVTAQARPRRALVRLSPTFVPIPCR